jgi:hypothetical protein
MIVYPRPDLLNESSPAWGNFMKENITHVSKGKNENFLTIVKGIKENNRLTLLALRTCSLLVGSIPNPVHETKIKSVSCPVCNTSITIFNNVY